MPRARLRAYPRSPRLSSPDDRCGCEEELCKELLARLAVFPKMKSTLESRGLPPKLLSLTSGKQTEEVQLQLESIP